MILVKPDTIIGLGLFPTRVLELASTLSGSISESFEEIGVEIILYGFEFLELTFLRFLVTILKLFSAESLNEIFSVLLGLVKLTAHLTASNKLESFFTI